LDEEDEDEDEDEEDAVVPTSTLRRLIGIKSNELDAEPNETSKPPSNARLLTISWQAPMCGSM
jgi:hypothetical protein